jgi:hypothetical protein
MDRTRAFLAVGGLAAGVSASGLRASQEPVAVETCVPRDPGLPLRRPTEGQRRPGFELIDWLGGDAWLTLDWTVAEFEAVSLGWSRPFWRKNDPRRGTADGGRFLRSPGCAADGEFTYLNAYGREFVQVVELQELPSPGGPAGIREVRLKKYHVVSFDPGTRVRVLHSPTGERFVLVAETFTRMSEPTLPDGWTLTEHTPASPAVVVLVGEVRVLRLDNEDSFQGPLSDDEWAQLRGPET